MCLWKYACFVSGEYAPIDELVDFIVAAQIATRLEGEKGDNVHDAEEKNEVLNASCTK